MLCISLLLLYLASSQTYRAEDDDQLFEIFSKFKCTLPPFPENGAYSVLQPQPEKMKLNYLPGHQLTSYTIAWRCYRSHNLLGPSTQTCFEDGSFDNPDESVQCVRNSSIHTYDDTKSYKCTLPPFPKNGSYEVLEAEPGNWNPTSQDSDFTAYGPGEKVKSYRLLLYCNPGYNLTAPSKQNCFKDGTVYVDSFDFKCANSTDYLNLKPDKEEVNAYVLTNTAPSLETSVIYEDEVNTNVSTNTVSRPDTSVIYDYEENTYISTDSDSPLDTGVIFENEKNTYNCTLPPFPKNGSYSLIEVEPAILDARSQNSHFNSYGPGEKVRSYRLIWSCFPPYRLTGPGSQTCLEDGSLDADNVECTDAAVITTIKPVIDEEKTYNCTLPPFPKFGSYILLSPQNSDILYTDLFTQYPDPLGPGDKVKAYTLKWYCYYSHGFLGPKTQKCFEDGSIDQPSESVECVPYCKMESNNGQNVVTSCGKEARCIVPPQHLTEVSQLTLSSSSPTLDVNEDCRFTTIGALSNGWNVKPGTLPWHAGIYTKRKSPYLQVCGGSLVSSTVVISAAHCFWNELEKKQQPASDYAVAVGKIYRPWNDTHDNHAQKSDVTEVKIPPHFKGSTTNLQDDIALVIVTYPFKLGDEFNVRPVCLDFNVELDNEQLSPGDTGKVAGWGLTSEDGEASPILKQAHFPVIDINQCYARSDFTFQTRITSDKFCAGHLNGTAVCKGDSGGGLVFLDYSKAPVYRHILRGIVSGAPDSSHLCNTYAWASFTHLLKHEHFIRETVPEKLARTDTPKSVGEL